MRSCILILARLLSIRLVEPLLNIKIDPSTNKYLKSVYLYAITFFAILFIILPIQALDCNYSCDSSAKLSQYCNIGGCNTSDGCLPCGTTFYAPRSQGTNLVRQLIEWNPYLYKPNWQECYKGYTAISLAFEYTHSFKSENIAKTMFCTDCLTFSGSQAPNRNDKIDLVADYFGLAPNFHRRLKIKPYIENFIVDLGIYTNLSDILSGLYIKIQAPIVYTRWSLGLDECVACEVKPAFNVTNCTDSPLDQNSAHNLGAPCVKNPTPYYPANYMSVGCEGSEIIPLNSLHEALNGTAFGASLSGNNYGDMIYPWTYGRFSFCPLEKTTLADIDIVLGVNFYESYRGHLGVFGKAVAPTGNRPNGKYIFEPIVGNRKHWELGGGISFHQVLFSDYNDPCNRLAFYFEGYVVHMFENDQIRSFDFRCNGLLSRYLLLKQLEPDKFKAEDQSLYGPLYESNNIILENNSYSLDTSSGQLINAIDFATRNARVKIDAKGELIAMLSYINNGLGFDFGYNLYGRTQEKIHISTKCPCTIDKKALGIKGTEGVGYFEFDVDNNIIDNNNIVCKNLNSTQSKATMFSPTSTQTVDNGVQVKDIDSNNDGTIGITYNSSNPDGDDITNLPNDVIVAKRSIAPVTISCLDLNPNSAANCAQLTHKIFLNLNYRWQDLDYNPNIGIGFEVEFNEPYDNTKKNNSKEKCKSIKKGLNQFGLWVKSSLVF